MALPQKYKLIFNNILLPQLNRGTKLNQNTHVNKSQSAAASAKPAPLVTVFVFTVVRYTFGVYSTETLYNTHSINKSQRIKHL